MTSTTRLKKPPEFFRRRAFPQAMSRDIARVDVPSCAAIPASVIPPHVRAKQTSDSGASGTKAGGCD